MLFFITLILGTLITVSSNSWLRAWIGLEINLLSFIPLIIDNKNLISSEAAIKYFLVQVITSSILLIIIIYYILSININIIMYNNISNLLIISTLILKIGIAPFHFWFPIIIEGINWSNSLILLTWQKIAPLILLSYIILENIIIPIIIISIIISSIGGINQTSLRKIIAFSSINHLSWMTASIILSKTIWINYLLFYFFLSLTLIIFFYYNKLYYITQLYSIFNYSNEIKLILFLNFLSLGGLPPFLGFFSKWIVIELLSNNQLLLISLIVIITLLTLYFYIRLCYSSFILNYYETKWNNFFIINNFHYLYLFISFFSIFGLILYNFLFFIV